MSLFDVSDAIVATSEEGYTRRRSERCLEWWYSSGQWGFPYQCSAGYSSDEEKVV